MTDTLGELHRARVRSLGKRHHEPAAAAVELRLSDGVCAMLQAELDARPGTAFGVCALRFEFPGVSFGEP